MTSTQDEVEIGYDISNEFFRLWLDERMHYTSAVFDEQHTTLEQAQRNKSRWLADFAEVKENSLVLDIGCGWGANLEYLVLERKVQRAHGITLSRQQAEEIRARKLPGVTMWVADYKDFVPPEKYDALISIEMIDHLVSPAQHQAGEAVGIYREYFNKCAKWVKPGAYFGFQAILRDRMPRNRADLEDLRQTADVIFPGGQNPRLEDLVAACGQSWEIIQLNTPRQDYGKTTAEWLRRMRLNKEKIMASGWGGKLMSNGINVWENYERYLSTCVKAFANHWSSDVQMKLRLKD
ncbi:MAG: SAM-dependent methyltransferase [Archangium sp.]